MRISSLVVLLCLLMAPAFGQKREMQEMQRDLANLQDQVRILQKTQDERLAAIQALVQQAVDTSAKNATAIALLERSLNDRLESQAKTLNAPVATLSTRMDTIADQSAASREAIKDVADRMTKLQSQLTDIQTAISIIQNPPQPATPQGDASAPPAGVTSESLYSQARADFGANQFDLAFQGFADYLKFFPTGSYASNAQFYLGEIHRNRNEMDKALAAYDAVLEKYPEGLKRADAQYMKGRVLLQMGRKNDAAEEFKQVVAKYKATSPDLAAKAQDELRRMGMAAKPRGAK